MKCIYCGEVFNTQEGLRAHQDSCFYKNATKVIEAEIIEEPKEEIKQKVNKKPKGKKK